jgi:hypothetical protein
MVESSTYSSKRSRLVCRACSAAFNSSQSPFFIIRVTSSANTHQFMCVYVKSSVSLTKRYGKVGPALNID